MIMEQHQKELNTTTTGTATTSTTLGTTAAVSPLQSVTTITTKNTSSSLSTDNNNKTISTNNNVLLKNYCDLCWRKDGKYDMILQTCCICNVSVHNSCYGIEGIEFLQKNSTWKCWACASIGLTIKTRTSSTNSIDTNTNITKTNNNKQQLHIPIVERPTECVLCSVDDTNEWYHAMHPLYDSPGRRGRQIVIPADVIKNKPIRLAWVHTLCAYGVNNAFSTTGAIYGCTQDGQYNCDDDDNDDNDSDSNSDENGSINSYLNDKNVQDDLSIHHFVFDGPIPYVYTNNNNNTTTTTTTTSTTTRKIVKTWHDKAISDFQQLKCHICGSDDIGSLRVPVQCCANDHSEYKLFREIHRKVHGNESCFNGLHVGCAMWGKDDGGQYPNVRRVFYDPGNEDEDVNEKNDTIVSNVMCTAHAQDLQTFNISGCKRKDLRYPKDKISSAPNIISTTMTTAAASKNTKPKSNSKSTKIGTTSSKSEKKNSEWHRLSAVEMEKNINSSKFMMFDELRKKISSSQEDILKKDVSFQKRVKSIYEFYETNLNKKYGWDKHIVVQYFNIALNDVLRNSLKVPIDIDYDVSEFLLPPQRKSQPSIQKNKLLQVIGSTNNSNNNNSGRQILSATTATTTTVVHQSRNRPLPSIARENILLHAKQIEKRKKKKQQQQKQHQRQQQPQHLQESSCSQLTNQSSPAVGSIDTHVNNRNVAHLNNSILSTTIGEWDVGTNIANTSLSSTQPISHHPFGHTLKKEQQKNINYLKNLDNNRTSKGKQQKPNIVAAAAAAATPRVDHIVTEDSTREYSLDYVKDVEDGGLPLAMIPDSNKSQQYCDDIVLDILVQEMEYERKASSLLSGHDTFATDNTNMNNDELLDNGDSLQCILQSTKEKWKVKVVNDVGQSSSLSIDEFEQLWETNILQRVYKALNYSPIPIDWSFLSDERKNTEKYLQYFEQM